MAGICDSDCVATLEAKLGTRDFEILEYRLEPFGDFSGYQGIHNILKIQAVYKGETQTFKFFVKSTDKEGAIYKKRLKPSRVYLKEHVFLTEIINDLQKHSALKIAPKCYHAELDSFIILENLHDLGYKMIGRDELNTDHVVAVINTLAHLHASSIIFEETTGVKLEEKYEKVLFESFFTLDYETTWLDMFSTVMSQFINTHCLDLDDDFRKRICADLKKCLFEMVKPSKKYRNVVCHGDLWENNFLFKNDITVEAVLVDFQTQRFTPPALDLELLRHVISSNKELPYDHFDMREIYYTALGDILASKSLDVAKLLPRDVFTESCDYYAEFGLVIRFAYSFFVRMPLEHLSKIVATAETYGALFLDMDFAPVMEAFEKHSQYRVEIDFNAEATIKFFKSKYLAN